MYLSRVEIAGIKGFRPGPLRVDLDLSRPDGGFAGWTVLAGRNGAGKSSLLKAIALVVAGPAAARALQPSFSGWIHTDKQEGLVVARFVPEPKHDRFLNGDAPSKSFKAHLSLLQFESGPEPSLHFGSSYPMQVRFGNQQPTLMKDPATSTSELEDGPWAVNPRGWFIAGYGPYRRLASAAEAQRSISGSSQVNRLVGLFLQDGALVEAVQWLREHHFRRLEDKVGAKELIESVLELLNDGLLPDSTRVSHIDTDGLWVTQGARTFPLRDMSDGYRTTTALVLDLARQLQTTYQEFKLVQQNGTWCVPYPGVVLIDEVELHLHVSWQRRIGFWLKRHFPNIQFIVTTHSPFVCQAADPKGLIRLPAPGEERTAEHVSDELFRTVVNGTVDEAVLTELFGLDHVHSEESERLRTRVAELEVRLMDGKATEEDRAEFESLSAQLPDTGSALVDRAVRSLGLDK
ncbi:AAA family ATPase [Pyxidicoccus parkwayensis]|uniref:AAA family ATPase n=1 Tax=Pyxidicoccus parkwayensis TaxID=2813578 RepID=A0ABX7NQ75_9BACT|nr:AAA family ATPase [Pyxidicoccus parkwaysis]QSQ21015.1 AAA family ATPase [Pyxidicoccus parkwaysis]